jgi:four helix bundle protein
VWLDLKFEFSNFKSPIQFPASNSSSLQSEISDLKSQINNLPRLAFQISDLKFPTCDLTLAAVMTYQRFEDVPVWQTAAELYEATESLLENDTFHATRAFRDQLDRAALSVSNNIAEGFERGTANELLAFLYIARGSAGEVRSMLCLRERRARKLNWPADLKSQISNLKSKAESCSRQLRGWADSLQNSDIQGPRHLNNRSREAFEQKKRAADLQTRLLQNLPANHPLRRAKEESA